MFINCFESNAKKRIRKGAGRLVKNPLAQLQYVRAHGTCYDEISEFKTITEHDKYFK